MTCSGLHAQNACKNARQYLTATVKFFSRSTRDLISQLSLKCPEGCPIPSEQRVNLNFCPRNPRAKVAEYFCGHLQAKRMIQK